MRNPFLISLLDLPRQEGASMPWDAQLPAPRDFGVELIGVPEGDPLDIHLTLQSVSEGVWLSGTVHATAHGECARCLQDLEEDITETIGELVLYPERRKALEDQGDDEAHELPVIQNEHIDIEPIVRDAVVAHLPFRPLCRPDCPGLCPECGERWEDLPEDHHHDHTNPSFDALADLEAALRAAGDDK
ncbi:MAG: DUF177 domain-containing protein [Ancrocorticia sp.]|jgi:uncharacterized protein|nr:DUF177 domain-containing protein [Ancrocorticia sp.]MCI1895776.1 DUF177 domain-containing protein [Ancrocorticia sp.]MCI1932770.1 DUF177 domain-containing protein [Ancrocorticia sp.]MCI2013319.1 DUF177 domain-containing protein [Ancrocorticia sp.]MCI2030086.1 DUF177 domain-containing protein [Ancrocorticia sp.]